MGVAVLYPHDCLGDGVSLHHHRRLISPPRSKARRNSVARNPSATQNRSGPQKQWSPSGSPPPPQSRPNNEGKANRAKSPGLTGQIRILKRGEKAPLTVLSTAATTPVKNNKTKREGSVDRANSDPVALSTHHKIPDLVPAPIPNFFVDGFYAGSAFSTSPPPSSLPLPAFCTKSIGSNTGVAGLTKSDVASLDLRRMLRIE